MTLAFWQAKIWGLLHDPALKALHNNTSGRGDNSFWQELEVMSHWKTNNWNPEESTKKILKHIKLADYITSASDRGAIGSLSTSIDYHDTNGLEISHLLSGQKIRLKLHPDQHQQIIQQRKTFLSAQEELLRQQIPNNPRPNPLAEIKRIFWWLWRCLPQATLDLFQDETLLLMPAETRLPDSSIWNHASLTAAIAGSLAGYELTPDEIDQKWLANKPLSHPYLAAFSFSPVQELIKASRKMRDLWSGSWILHYLSAKVSWKLATQYGPDSLLYPSLYQQPLIDHWLLEQYPEFSTWINKPSPRQLLTAGFPNVIIIILPKDKVSDAMLTAKSELINAYRELSKEVFAELKQRKWMPQLYYQSKTWSGWLESQWQIYWTGVPIGHPDQPLTSSEIYRTNEQNTPEWTTAQNLAYNLITKEKALFLQQELSFLQAAAKIRWDKWQRHPFSTNVGSWWAAIYDQTRLALSSVKNARTWEIPTAFGPRSSISGIGPVVHPGNDWISEGEIQHYWKRHAGLFDGIEQLNATETLKRGLHKILPKLLKLNPDQTAASYPDLTAGIAGYLKQGGDLEYFHQAAKNIRRKVTNSLGKLPDDIIKAWGIPYIDEHSDPKYREHHPRILNAGWLIEELELDIPQVEIPTYRSQIQTIIEHHYPNNNPTNWYVIAMGDGDGMSEWLLGQKMKSYSEYIASNLNCDPELQTNFEQFLKLPKRMGPSTHSALSRALLDFSNQLVPYLTEQRYAGKLIYSGGDDVLAYTNLWEWDNWLWDIRQCFRGDEDPQEEFDHQGNYWKWKLDHQPKNLAQRPLFTMGEQATISFGVVIAHHSVPLAIALDNLRQAETQAKEHIAGKNQKDATQIRVLYGNGNILTATAKFQVFNQWRKLLTIPNLEASIFEQAAAIWKEHPVPSAIAINNWTEAFSRRREQLTKDQANLFKTALSSFLNDLYSSPENNFKQQNATTENWLKLAAFILRQRKIKLEED